VASAFNAQVADITQQVQRLSARVDTVQRTDVCKLAQGIANLRAARAVVDESIGDLEQQTKASFESLESRLEDATKSLEGIDGLDRRLAETEASLKSLDELDSVSRRLELTESGLVSAVETLGEMRDDIDGVGDQAKDSSQQLVNGLRDMQDKQESLRVWCADQLERIRPLLAAESDTVAGKILVVEKECTRALAEVCHMHSSSTIRIHAVRNVAR
jgi:chromosome segregation ATPase